MRVDTNSKNYTMFRKIMHYASFTGGCLAFDSAVMPWLEMLFGKKYRVFKYLGWLGTYGISLYAGSLASSGVDTALDSLTEMVNGGLWESEEGDATTIDGIDIPGKNATPNEELQFVHALVGKYHPFEFKSEKAAKGAVELAAAQIEKFGHCDIPLYFVLAGQDKLPYEAYDIALKYGWTADDVKDWGIDKINDDCYIVDMFNYHDISDLYHVFKED